MENNIIEIAQTKIYNIRNTKVMLDSNLAELYEEMHITNKVVFLLSSCCLILVFDVGIITETL